MAGRRRKKTSGSPARSATITKATESPRRALRKSLPKTGGQYLVHEGASTTRAIFFEWLDWLGRELDLEADGWMMEVARRWLERREPGEDWEAVFAKIGAVRPSSEHDQGWEVAREAHRDDPKAEDFTRASELLAVQLSKNATVFS